MGLLMMRYSPTWAVIATSGTLSACASAVPSSKLIAPGPRVAMNTPALARQPAVDVRHKGCGLFVANQDESD